MHRQTETPTIRGSSRADTGSKEAVETCGKEDLLERPTRVDEVAHYEG